MQARTAKNEKKLASASSYGGKIRARKRADDVPLVITSERQLQWLIDSDDSANASQLSGNSSIIGAEAAHKPHGTSQSKARNNNSTKAAAGASGDDSSNAGKNGRGRGRASNSKKRKNSNDSREEAPKKPRDHQTQNK